MPRRSPSRSATPASQARAAYRGVGFFLDPSELVVGQNQDAKIIRQNTKDNLVIVIVIQLCWPNKLEL